MTTTSAVWAKVRAIVARVFGVDGGVVQPESELRSFESFSSIRLVELVEDLEAEFGVEFSTEDLAPERLRKVSDLADCVTRRLDSDA